MIVERYDQLRVGDRVISDVMYRAIDILEITETGIRYRYICAGPTETIRRASVEKLIASDRWRLISRGCECCQGTGRITLSDTDAPPA